MSYVDYDTATPVCKYCGSNNLKRRVGRVALARSEDSRLDSLMDDPAIEAMEDDPRAMGQFMRRMNREMGEDLGDEFHEVISRLERGESPESIERSMPDLGESDGGGLDL